MVNGKAGIQNQTCPDSGLPRDPGQPDNDVTGAITERLQQGECAEKEVAGQWGWKAAAGRFSEEMAFGSSKGPCEL